MALLSRKDKVKKVWYREYGEALFFALILALIIRTFLFQAFKIPSGSMEDTLLIGDHLLVNKFIYGTRIPFTDRQLLTLRDPARGDIIVFEFPPDRDKPFYRRRDFIKRIVGLPGDRVEIREKQVWINGELYELEQAMHRDNAVQEGPRDFLGPFTVPENHYFVLGDNRDYSLDSRFWGFVPEKTIKGLAFIKYWSWDRERRLPRWNRIARLIR